MSRILYCLFNTTNQLMEHGWRVHQTNLDQKISTALDEPIWECRDRSTDETIHTYDFKELFNVPGHNWRFYKNLIPYQLVASQDHSSFVGRRTSLGFLDPEQVESESFYDCDYMILDLARYKVRFVSVMQARQEHGLRFLESYYRAFVRQLEQDRLATLSLQFMQHQSRMLQKIATDSHHLAYNSIKVLT